METSLTLVWDTVCGIYSNNSINDVLICYESNRIMTKKYWNDWKRRIGETINIHLFWNRIDGTIIRKANSGLLDPEDRIVKATFHEKSVDLTIERSNYYYIGSHYLSKNEYITLEREKIACIIFKKNGK